MKNKVIIYRGSSELPELSVHLENETVWLSLDEMAVLFQRNKSTISRHIKNIFTEGELEANSVVAKFATTASDGKVYNVDYYNLDVIISVGYRVKSIQGTRFRQWATERIKEYIVKGFTIDDDRMKGVGGGNYWKELLSRIRDIRSSEKMMYRQVLDLYATAIDYDSKSLESITFFKIVQNKLHYATHGKTASELIYMRVDAEKPFVGMTNFKGAAPTQADVLNAKNFLEEKELKVLNNLVTAYFDLAELNAIEEKPMYMKDYIAELDALLRLRGKGILNDAGSISHQKAKEKAVKEYKKYKLNTLSPVEKDYLNTINSLEKEVKKRK